MTDTGVGNERHGRNAVLADRPVWIERTADAPEMVPPSPKLADKMKADLAQLRAKTKGPLSRVLAVRDYSPPGKDDGLIYPGDLFPLGTSAEPVRRAAADRAPITGTIRAIVVLAEFPDKKFGESPQHYKDLFFSTGVLPNGSLREYFAEVSNGQVDIVGEVVGPYTLPRKLTEYAHGDSGVGGASPNGRTMAKDAAVAANAAVNYAQYDNDGDGFVDAFIVIHAGEGAEETGSANDIWSHKWVLEGGAYTADGVKVYAYATVPEDAKIGVCCHELGHALFGFPDLYDTDGTSEGVGSWCLMGSGSWNGGGELPSHPSAWCKVQQGWVTIACPSASTTQSIQAVETGHAILRLWKDCAGGQEFFLVENRQRIGSDAKLPGDGLLIWHIDDAIGNNTNENHPKVRLVQADGKKDLENGANRGDAGDPYPGTAGNTSFTKTTTPNSLSYGGVDTCISLTNISPSGAVMNANVATSCIIKLKKESLKDQIKEVKELKKDQIKEIKKDLVKEIKMDGKPIKDKVDVKKIEIPGGWPQWGTGRAKRQVQDADISVLEARIAALEARLGLAEPFIEESLRPDLRQGGLSEEEDYEEMFRRTGRRPGPKRALDTPQGGW
ncbi:MAG: M6 family metalloprotease domain-containing protein [Methanoregulaceae archaeon]